MTGTVYRFLPWARRGLAAALPRGGPDDAPLPRRGVVTVQAVLTGGTTPEPVENSATLHAPGDVLGLDLSTIVRTTPAPGTTDAEPNYLATVDFDDPELPWMMTPSGPSSSGRLRPWLVLVVVRARDGVGITVPAGAPLPQLRIEDAANEELPDLADSWAWAHAQLLDQDAGASQETVGVALRDHPARNVSRLVCPRRLTDRTAWLACLVPAFDAGVDRGLGREPSDDGVLAPAWEQPDNITLPVYYHWEFTTGPAGDFESLARKLRPHRAAATVGITPMDVSRPGHPALDLAPGEPVRIMEMDGALRAPTSGQPDLTEIDPAVRSGLAAVTAQLADAADGRLDDQAAAGAQPVGPPVLGSFITRRPTVDETGRPAWFRELNLDPRTRVAAGLGAEVVRRNQEDLVRAAWQQVGSVLEAEAALSRARLAAEAARRFHERHLAPQPPHRLVQLTAPMAARTIVGTVSVPAAIRPTSLPDQALDSALRRLLSPSGHVAVRTARATGARPQVVKRLAEGTSAVDPTRFPVVAISGVGQTRPEPAGDGTVSLQSLGAAVRVPETLGVELITQSERLASARIAPGPARLRIRPDLRRTGIVAERHLEIARTVAGAEIDQHGGAVEIGFGSGSVLDSFTELQRSSVGSGLLAEPTREGIDLRTLTLRRGGRLAARNRETGVEIDVARIGASLSGSGLGEILSRLPQGVLNTDQGVVLDVGHRVGELEVRMPSGEQVAPMSNFHVPPLVTNGVAIDRFENAIGELADHTPLTTAPPAKAVVPFDLSATAKVILHRTDPAISHTARRDAMIRIGDVAVGRLTDRTVLPGWVASPAVDRVMAYPVLDLPFYRLLDEYDTGRFCPGLDNVPVDSVTLLHTNPRFVAAFLAGVNHELAAELLWRRYPTDQRGTPVRRFWNRLDGRSDIGPMHQWTDAALAHQTPDPDGNLVLLLRGQLLRRYPRTIVMAVRALDTGETSTKPEPSTKPEDVRPAIIAGTLGSDTAFYGFDLDPEDVTRDPGWFFVLMEPPTEPRFGFDAEPEATREARPTSWNDIAWSDLDVTAVPHLTHAALDALPTPPVHDSADVAAALFQRPFELLVLGKHLLP